MCEQLGLVEREIGRRHHGDPVRADIRGMSRELDRVPRRLGTTVHRDEQSAPRGLDVELCRPHPLLDRQQEALARRPQREQTVKPAGREEVDVGSNSVLVKRLAGVLQRCHSRGQRASQHTPTLS
jgi:hypothetical protein